VKRRYAVSEKDTVFGSQEFERLREEFEKEHPHKYRFAIDDDRMPQSDSRDQQIDELQAAISGYSAAMIQEEKRANKAEAELADMRNKLREYENTTVMQNELLQKVVTEELAKILHSYAHEAIAQDKQVSHGNPAVKEPDEKWAKDILALIEQKWGEGKE